MSNTVKAGRKVNMFIETLKKKILLTQTMTADKSTKLLFYFHGLINKDKIIFQIAKCNIDT